ncbi:MAG: 16S rRNA (cytidine(1402)-2'-O)-methyltransferase [Desulfobacterales bacterium]|nr:16S rRNA (cytidine(1402)-2'-O)-methyltransferase [Desulfobacterales bacterium]
MSDSNNTKNKGVLYVVATPIGNREDITLRALNILRDVDLIAAEDTRKTGNLLAHYQIKNRLISFHEHNEKKRTPEIIGKLLDAISIALVSNAGTPSISDPGYRLIEAAIANKITVSPIPGVSAATAAMSVSALPTDSFVFIGFLPRKKAKRQQFLNELAVEPRPVIFYESPKRILTLLEEIISCMGDRPAVLAREMTKLHEEFIRGSVSKILKTLKSRAEIKGECTLLIAGFEGKEELNSEIITTEIKAALDKHQEGLSEITKSIAQKYGLSKNKVYAMALKVKSQTPED